VDELDNESTQFMVEERRLSSIVEDEFVFRVLDEAELPSVVEDFNNGPQRLSRNVLARMKILLHPSFQSTTLGSTLFCSLLFSISHCVGDGAAIHSILKTFLDFLVSASDDYRNFETCD
jgi:hypothetical protein